MLCRGVFNQDTKDVKSFFPEAEKGKEVLQGLAVVHKDA
jgi:hypothetical protein